MHACVALQEGQSLYILGKNINSCTYELLPGPGHETLQQLVSAMLQPSPQARPSIGDLVDMVEKLRPK